MEKQSWFKTKKVMIIIALISLLSGFVFMKNSGITGNVVVSSYQPISLLSIVGLLLIFCAIILALYITKKE